MWSWSLVPSSYVRYHWNPEPVCNKSHFVSCVEIFWAEIYRRRLFLGPNLVSFNRKLRTVFVSATEHGSSAGYHTPLMKIFLTLKRKCDPEVSYHLSYVRYHWNSEPWMLGSRESENDLAISRSSSASKSVEIFWAEICWGQNIRRFVNTGFRVTP
jgi:hypothetical protein